jgi:hypothetical protein
MKDVILFILIFIICYLFVVQIHYTEINTDYQQQVIEMCH